VRLTAPATQDGVVVGTPGYMAPEQYLMQPADARSDQFSFCVALYRALYGQAPFAGVTYRETRASVLAGRVRPPPRDADAPAWVFRVLARGLRARQGDRYGSMDELLAALARDPAARRRRAALAALALAVPIASALATHRLARAPASAVCAGGGPKVQEVWGAAAQAEAERAFGATGKAYAPAAFRQTKAALDAYLGRWAAAHREACEATQVRHELTAEVMGARMDCLEARRREARALVRVLGEADADVVERATRAVESLPGLEACDDFASLLAAEPLPHDAGARAEVEAVRAELATAKAYVGAGKYDLGRQMGEALGRRAAEVGSNALRAEALELVGRTASGTRDFGAAVPALKQAVWAAEAARADEIKARAEVGLVYAAGELGAFDDAHDWGAYAAASARRLGEGGAIEASRLSAEGWAYFRQGKHDEAVDFLRRSLAAAERSQGLSPEALGLVYNRLGNVLAERQRFDEALAFLKREETLLARSLGPGHPALVPNLNDTAAILLDRRRYDEAIALLERARGLSGDAGLAPSVFTLANLGEAYEGLGRNAEAFDLYERASRLAEGVPSPQAWLVAVLAVRRGRTLVRLGRAAEGRLVCAEGLEGVRRALPADHEFVADALECGAEALLRLGRRREARELVQKALPVRARLANAEKLSGAQALLARAMSPAGGLNRGKPRS
jgi:tetratricopeptide (TPR) repeat protein